ncbi:MAG: hypothetical protein HY820_22495 [Acidobacteria bacterium]|nr:hypothetical protein [Acidobacteriota bacterium]
MGRRTALWGPVVKLLLLLPALLLQAQSAREYVERGMQKFVRNEIAASINDFDEAAKLEPESAPHLWQRGIAYYYVKRYEDGRKQFEVHRTVNPNDVENAAWWYLCMAKLGRREEARAKLLPVGPDDRVPMTEVYALYAGRGAEKDVLAAIAKGNPDTPERKMREFYGYLYLGLYAETHGDLKKAREMLRKSVDTQTGGYMLAVARIHLNQLK